MSRTQAHFCFLFSLHCTSNLYRTVMSEQRYEPNCVFSVPLHPYSTHTFTLSTHIHPLYTHIHLLNYIHIKFLLLHTHSSQQLKKGKRWRLNPASPWVCPLSGVFDLLFFPSKLIWWRRGGWQGWRGGPPLPLCCERGGRIHFSPPTHWMNDPENRSVWNEIWGSGAIRGPLGGSCDWPQLG